MEGGGWEGDRQMGHTCSRMTSYKTNIETLTSGAARMASSPLQSILI